MCSRTSRSVREGLGVEVGEMCFDARPDDRSGTRRFEPVALCGAHLDEGFQTAYKCLQFPHFRGGRRPCRRLLHGAEAGDQFSVYTVGLGA